MPLPLFGPRSVDSAHERLLIGVCHLGPLPGSPRFSGHLDAVIERAVEDARCLIEGGADLCLIENFGDTPFYPGSVPPETVAAMTRVVAEVCSACAETRSVAGRSMEFGVNVLRNDPQAALAICAATGASFIRVNVHVGAMVTDQGLIEGRAAWTVRERARLAPEVAILADVRVKHAAPLAGEGSIEEDARDVLERGMADAVIVTGSATGAPPTAAELESVRAAIGDAPLLVGSGVDASNAAALLTSADGAIVGTSLKRGGRVSEPIELERVAGLRAVLDSL